MKILFLHGWQSVPGGVKLTYLKDHGHEVINPKLPDEVFAEAVRIAQVEFDKHWPDVRQRADQELFQTLGRHDEFTLFCAVVLICATCSTASPRAT